jgi:two-component system phosphate regulon sensor histidine kinase PhoR
MTWFLPRLLATIVALALGSALGVMAGALLNAAAVGAVAGAVAGVGVLVLRDALHAGRLVRWLRDSPTADAPRDAGLWGELAYRVERALRLRDQALAAEQQRLGEFLSAIEASPNGVLLLDADDQIVWCSAVAADHLGLDAQRDLRQPITNLVRMPAFVAYLQDRAWREPVAARCRWCCAPMAISRSWSSRKTSPNACAPKPCAAISSRTCRMRSARR